MCVWCDLLAECVRYPAVYKCNYLNVNDPRKWLLESISRRWYTRWGQEKQPHGTAYRSFLTLNCDAPLRETAREIPSRNATSPDEKKKKNRCVGETLGTLQSSLLICNPSQENAGQCGVVMLRGPAGEVKSSRFHTEDSVFAFDLNWTPSTNFSLKTPWWLCTEPAVSFPFSLS